MNNLKQLLSISGLILIYEFLFIILYYLININRKYLSWPLFINIFIIIVVLFCECNIDNKTKFIIIFIKLIFLLLILNIADISINYYLISIIILIIYYLIVDINYIYNCDVKISCLINSLIISTIIYYIMYLLK